MRVQTLCLFCKLDSRTIFRESVITATLVCSYIALVYENPKLAEQGIDGLAFCFFHLAVILVHLYCHAFHQVEATDRAELFG